MKKVKMDPVLAECRRIQELQDRNEKRDATLQLWQEHGKEKLAAAPILSAELIIHLMCLQAEDAHSAISYIRMLLAHPDIYQLEPTLLATIHSDLMRMHFSLGEEEQALAEGRTVLGMEQLRVCLRWVMIRSDLLYGYLLECSPAEQASSALTDFVWELLQLQDRRLKHRFLPGQADYTALVDALARTFSQSERRQILTMRPLCTQKASRSPLEQRLFDQLQEKEPH